MINVALSGLTGGALYVAIALGIVVVYRFSHTINFAHGAIATLASYVAYDALRHGAPYWVAVLLALAAGTVGNLVIGLLITRFFLGASELVSAMATLGPALALIGLVGVIWGQDAQSLPTPHLLRGAVHLGSYRVSAMGLAVLGITVVVTLALTVYLRYTRQGTLLRATADSRGVAALNGVRVVTLERFIWAFAGALAGGAGLLITPQLSLTPQSLTNLLITGFAAAVLGGLSSLSGLIVGGLLFGVIVAFAQYYFQAQISSTIALVILIIVLTMRPTGLFGNRTGASLGLFPLSIESAAGGRRRAGGGWPSRLAGGSALRSRLGQGRRGSPSQRRSLLVIAAVSIVVVVAAPYVVSDPMTFMLSSAAIMVIAIAGQNVLSGLSGLLSMAQGGFMLLGSYVAGLLSAKAGAPQSVAILVGVLSGVLVAAVVSVGVSRLSGLYLAILTVVFSLSVSELASDFRSLTGGDDGLLTSSFSIAGHDFASNAAVFRVCAVFAAISLVLVTMFKRARVGLLARGVRDSQIGAESIGINVRWPRIAAFCVAGACAGLAGALATFQLGAVTPVSFDVWTSIYILFAGAVGGAEATLIGPIVGALFISGLPYVLSGSGALSQVIFGLTVFVLLVVRTVFTAAPSGREEEPTVAQSIPVAKKSASSPHLDTMETLR
jgi:branched-chain amino acid transport system permease protein